MNKTIFGILAILVLVFGCIGTQPPIQQNVTNQTNQTALKFVKEGSIVSMDYTLMYTNGTVIETTSEEVAKINGLYNSGATYGPVTFQVYYGQLIEGFVDGVLGMKEGESKQFSVSPEKGYGVLDQANMYYMPLNSTMEKFEIVSRSVIESQNKTIEKDSVLSYDHGGLIVISDFDNDTVTLEYMLDNGYEFRLYGYPLIVTNSTNDTISLYLNVTKGDVLKVNPNGVDVNIRVSDMNETHALFDGNHPLAGETLVYVVNIESINN